MVSILELYHGRLQAVDSFPVFEQIAHTPEGMNLLCFGSSEIESHLQHWFLRFEVLMAKAKLEWGEKSKAIREALSTHPYLKNSELVEHLKLRGIECTAQDVSSQKARLKMQASGHASLSVDQLLKIKGIIADAGGLKAVQQRLDEVDRIAQQAGGLIKLKQGMQILPEIANS